MSVQTELYRLSCGVPLIEIHDPNRGTAFSHFSFAVGSRHETPSTNGVSHFLEHLAFKGTPLRPSAVLKNEIADMGAEANAATSQERTYYTIDALSEDAPHALEILSDICLNSALPPDEVEKERGPILQEIGEKEDKPQTVAFDALLAAAYPDNMLGAKVIGPRENVAHHITLDTFRAFKAKHYNAENLIVTVAGNFDQEQVRDTLEQALSDIQHGNKTRAKPAVYQGGDARQLMAKNQIEFFLAFESAAAESDEEPQAEILAKILGGGMSSRLFRTIRDERGLVYGTGAGMDVFSDTGLFLAGASAAPKNMKEVIPLLCDELTKARDGLTEEELERAKRQIRVTRIRNGEDLSGRAETASAIFKNTGNLWSIDDDLAKVQAVTLDDLHAFATKVFSGKPTVSMAGPVGQMESYDQIRQRLAP